MLVKPNTLSGVAPLISLLKSNKQQYYFLGNGSNTLVSSDGYDGVVILIANNLSKIELLDNNEIYCQAGAALAKLCITAQKYSLSGLEFAFGIPSTVGGSIYMNAGAYGGEIKDVLKSCTYIDKNGEIKTKSCSELDFSYRHSFFSDNEACILSGIFALDSGDKALIKSKMDEILQCRKDKQPLEFPSAGSTFKRPNGNYASVLIEQCGLKGLSVGGAEVSTKHSGFIINKNNATSDDVITLVEQIQDIVYKKTGYKLECEIRRLGF